MAREWGKSLNTYSADEYERDEWWNNNNIPKMRLKAIKKVKKTGFIKPAFKFACFCAFIYGVYYTSTLIK